MPTESIFQPAWSPDGRLYFVSDRTGWWNLYRTGAASSIEAMHPMTAEFGKPQWTFSDTTYAFMTATRIVVTYTEGGRWKMGLLETDPRRFEPIDLGLEALDGDCRERRELFFIGGSPTEAPAIVRMHNRGGGGRDHSIVEGRAARSGLGLCRGAGDVSFERSRRPRVLLRAEESRLCRLPRTSARRFSS